MPGVHFLEAEQFLEQRQAFRAVQILAHGGVELVAQLQQGGMVDRGGRVSGFRNQPLHAHHDPLQPGQRGGEIVPCKFQLASIMGLQAHQAIGEGVDAPVDQHL